MFCFRLRQILASRTNSNVHLTSASTTHGSVTAEKTAEMAKTRSPVKSADLKSSSAETANALTLGSCATCNPTASMDRMNFLRLAESSWRVLPESSYATRETAFQMTRSATDMLTVATRLMNCNARATSDATMISSSATMESACLEVTNATDTPTVLEKKMNDIAVTEEATLGNI